MCILFEQRIRTILLKDGTLHTRIVHPDANEERDIPKGDTLYALQPWGLDHRQRDTVQSIIDLGHRNVLIAIHNSAFQRGFDDGQRNQAKCGLKGKVFVRKTQYEFLRAARALMVLGHKKALLAVRNFAYDKAYAAGSSRRTARRRNLSRA